MLKISRLKTFIFLATSALSLFGYAAPDRYTNYLINKPVDWLSFGLARSTVMYAESIEVIARSLEIDKKITRMEALELRGWIDYDFDNDEFYLFAEMFPDRPVSAKICNQVRTKLKRQLVFTSFAAHFFPRGFEYNDVPTGLANKILEKSFFVCGKQKYTITERF